MIPLLAAVMLIASCLPVGRTVLDTDEQTLLRLEYLERAARLPAINIESIEIPEEIWLGSFSPLVWKIRENSDSNRELYRPLPTEDLDLQLRQALVTTLEDYGFNMRDWSRPPDLRLHVRVEKLILTSEFREDEIDSRRVCDVQFSFCLEEHPSGVEIETFTSSGRWELPGSWLVMDGDEPRWLPRPDEIDPVDRATEVAALLFLRDSSGFWSDPANWEEGRINLSGIR
ncbi:MAG: hypothetical protein GY835_10835 [bacterium]|nr:hypothetical protein [bacterium]